MRSKLPDHNAQECLVVLGNSSAPLLPHELRRGIDEHRAKATRQGVLHPTELDVWLVEVDAPDQVLWVVLQESVCPRQFRFCLS